MKSIRRTHLPGIAWLLALALVAASCGDDSVSDATTTTVGTVAATTTSQPSGPVELTIGTGFNGVQYADIYVAIEEGFFAEENLDVDFLASNTPTGTAILSGETQINSGQPATTYIPNAQGADLVAIYSPSATFETWVAKDPISSVADLAGTTMGVFNLQDLDVIYTQWMFEQNGLSIDDIDLVASGGTGDKFAAVLANAVDSAPLYAPANFLADDEGLNLIFDTRDLDVGQVPTFYVVRASWAEENRETTIGFIRALNKAHEFLFDSANKPAAVQHMAKYTGVEVPLVELAYDLYFTNPGELYSLSGEWDRGIVELMADKLFEIGLLDEPPIPYESTVAEEYREAALGG